MGCFAVGVQVLLVIVVVVGAGRLLVRLLVLILLRVAVVMIAIVSEVAFVHDPGTGRSKSVGLVVGIDNAAIRVGVDLLWGFFLAGFWQIYGDVVVVDVSNMCDELVCGGLFVVIVASWATDFGGDAVECVDVVLSQFIGNGLAVSLHHKGVRNAAFYARDSTDIGKLGAPKREVWER